MAELQLASKNPEPGPDSETSSSLANVQQTLEEFEFADKWLQPFRP
jgi:hypothetical protein